MTEEEVLAEQQRLKVLFSAWMAEKMKHEAVSYQRENGDIVQHYPNGEIKVLKYAK